jgi:SAM-dependent methyltransferase
MPNVSVLCDETAWPLDTGVADKLVMMHGLETSERPSELLSEAHRVLGPGGRMILVVPNRAGLWSRRDRTPFGYGRPYTLGQLEAQVKQHGFVPERHLTTLYQPPSAKRVWRKTAPVFERIGSQMPVGMAGGAIMLEVSKQVYAPRGTATKDKVKSRLKALDGIARPVPKPV